jgi:hypothetical protein
MLRRPAISESSNKRLGLLRRFPTPPRTREADDGIWLRMTRKPVDRRRYFNLDNKAEAHPFLRSPLHYSAAYVNFLKFKENEIFTQ